MNCKVENGRLTIEKDGRTFSFEAHGEAPRPSLMGMGISAGGKHTSIQDVACGALPCLQQNYARKSSHISYVDRFLTL